MSNAEAHWQQAYAWLNERRRQAPANADIWHLRHHWLRYGPGLFERVRAGRYRLAPMQVYRRYQRTWVQWSAQDALVLKWVALQVEGLLPTHERCEHLKGRGGVRASVRRVSEALSYSSAWVTGDDPFTFVYRTDIRGYYRHIRKAQVLSQVRWHIHNPVLQDLITQYLYYSVEDAGEFHTPEQGICRGCALSPLIGASLLHHIDSRFAAQENTFYARYMDDFLVLTRTRWALRRAVKRLHEFFDLGGFEAHPDKTQLGRIRHGFEWMGVWFSAEGPAIGPRALENHRERRARLYEHAKATGLSVTETEARVRAYEARWQNWAKGMLRAVE